MPKPLCKIADSPIHGRGVFAAKKIERGQIITKYGNVGVDNESDYGMKFPDGIIRGGDPNRAIAAECGFMMNDTCKLCVDEKRVPTLKYVMQCFKDYNEKSDANTNVCFMDTKGTMIASRDIAKGEELFLTYGIPYWASRLIHTTHFPTIRFLTFVALVKTSQEPKMEMKLREAMGDEEKAHEMLCAFGFEELPPGMTALILTAIVNEQ